MRWKHIKICFDCWFFNYFIINKENLLIGTCKNIGSYFYSFNRLVSVVQNLTNLFEIVYSRLIFLRLIASGPIFLRSIFTKSIFTKSIFLRLITLRYIDHLMANYNIEYSLRQKIILVLVPLQPPKYMTQCLYEHNIFIWLLSRRPISLRSIFPRVIFQRPPIANCNIKYFSRHKNCNCSSSTLSHKIHDMVLPRPIVSCPTTLNTPQGKKMVCNNFYSSIISKCTSLSYISQCSKALH